MVRQLLGLEDVISLGLCAPTHDVTSWNFELDPGGTELSELRLALRLGDQQISETWLYRWTKS